MELIIKDNVINGTVYGRNILYGAEGEAEQLVIPNHVETIAENAFGYEEVNPGIKELTFEPGGHILIGSCAFAYSHLRSVDFSDSVKCICSAAFEKCSGLKDIVFGNNLKTIESGAFLGCTSIETLELPEGLETIESQAFQGCESLNRIAIPDSVSEMGSGCFALCNNIEHIECSPATLTLFFKSFKVKNRIPVMYRFLANKIKCSSEPNEQTIALIRKLRNELIDIITKEDNDVAASNFIRFLGELNKVDLQYFRTKIDANNAVNVRAVVLEANKGKASKTKSLLLDDAAKKMTAAEWKMIFSTRNGKEKGETVIIKYKSVDKHVTIPEKIGTKTVIGLDTFAFERTDISSVVMPNTIRWIGQFTFSKCEKLESVILSENLKEIEGFGGCSRLSSVRIPDGAESVEYCAFEKCTSLKDIWIPSSVKQIGLEESEYPEDEFESAFSGCNNLTIHTPSGSYAEEYAKKWNISFDNNY